MLDFHPISFPQGGGREYGLGVARYVMRGVVWEHEGAFPGYAAYMGYIPEEGISVVALTNAVFSPRPLADELLDAVLNTARPKQLLAEAEGETAAAAARDPDAFVALWVEAADNIRS
jgi:hypothetical protein